MGWPYYSGNSAELSSGRCSIPRLMGWNGSDLGGCPQWVWSPMVWLVLTEEEADTHTWMDRRGILESHCRILNLPPLTSTSPAATLRRERHPLTHPLETQLPSTRLFGHRERLWAVALAGGTAWPTDNAEDIDNYLAPGQKPTSVWSPSRLGWEGTQSTVDTPTTSRGRRRRRRATTLQRHPCEHNP